MPCSNATKTQNPLKSVGVPQTPEPISAVSGPKFTILSGNVEDILLLNKFFPIVDRCLSCEDIAGETCAMVIDGHKVNFARGKIPSGGKRSRKCIYGVPGQETAKHSAKSVSYTHLTLPTIYSV